MPIATGRPTDYSAPFRITEPVGNNAFAHDRRAPSASLWVPSLIECASGTGAFDGVSLGSEVVFEDVDEHGSLRSCTGLAHLVRTTWHGVPAVVMDNHNHAFYFWFEAATRGAIDSRATLVHIDQHRDTRVPDRMFDGRTLGDAFGYTNFELNVGNYIVPAQHAGLIGETQLITGQAGLLDLSLSPRGNKILNIDLDFFAPEMSFIDFSAAVKFISAHLPTASLITIATSPFFIDQALALRQLHRLRSATGVFLA